MGKKGVLLDNGKTAQSSMALYWKKNKQNNRKDKKQPKIDEEVEFEEKAKSGFEKWKLHKEKFITKAYQRKPQKKQNLESQRKQQEIEEEEIQIKQPSKEVKVIGFKSKDHLKNKLEIETMKQVDQSTNVLKLPSQFADYTEENIIQMLREKNAKRKITKQRQQRKKEPHFDVILGQDLLPKKEPSPAKEEKPEEKPEEPEKQEPLFKSEVLEQLSRGNNDVLKKPEAEEKGGSKEGESTRAVQAEQGRRAKWAFVPRGVQRR